MHSLWLHGRKILLSEIIRGFYGAGYCDVPAFSLVNETRFLADIPFARDRVIKYICTGLGFITGRQWHQGRVSHFQSENVIQEKGYSESDGIYS